MSCSGPIPPCSAEPQDFTGVRFKEIPDINCSRIFNQVAKEFSAFRTPIVSLLLGLQKNNEFDDRMKTVAGCTEHLLLLDGLSLWFKQNEQPTSRDLYDALVDAGCPEELLTKYKKPFKVRCRPDWCHSSSLWEKLFMVSF